MSKRNKYWYMDESDTEIEGSSSVFRTPLNFRHWSSPFSMAAVSAEEVEGGCEELYHTKKYAKVKSIPTKDIGEIATREFSRICGVREADDSTTVCNGDICTAGENAHALALKMGNAATQGKYSNAISLADYHCAASSGRWGHALAFGFGGNAAASGVGGNAAVFKSGWAISRQGHAVAFDLSSSAISYGSHGSAVACESGEAVSYGSQGKAVACCDGGTAFAYGRLGEAVALGEDGKASCSEKGLAIATGRGGLAKGIIGSWLILAERDRYERIISIAHVQVDGEQIKEDTWYTLQKGTIVVANDTNEVIKTFLDRHHKR